jgi:CRP-like cAMP-binding protein
MTTREHIKLLQAMPFFGAINDRSIELILGLSTTCEIPAGDYFYRQGDNGDCLYILEKGEVTIRKELENTSTVLCDIKEGGCFGELALITCTPRSASARAETDCRAIRIPQSALFNLYQHDAEQFLLIQMNMAREACRRLQQSDEQLFQTQLKENQQAMGLD